MFSSGSGTFRRELELAAGRRWSPCTLPAGSPAGGLRGKAHLGPAPPAPGETAFICEKGDTARAVSHISALGEGEGTAHPAPALPGRRGWGIARSPHPSSLVTIQPEAQDALLGLTLGSPWCGPQGVGSTPHQLGLRTPGVNLLLHEAASQGSFHQARLSPPVSPLPPAV